MSPTSTNRSPCPPDRRVLLAAAAAIVLAAAPRPASALFGVGDVVSDPLAQAKNVEKVAQLALQLEQLAEQLRQLEAQLADLDGLLADPGGDAFGRAGGAAEALTAVGRTLDEWHDELPPELDPASVTIDQLPERAAATRAYLRRRAADAEAALAAVEADRPGVAAEVASVVGAGNAAEGPKGAQQAANQLQAILAAEQSKLQALRLMRARLAADADAAQQGDEAAAEAVRQREMVSMRRSVERLEAEGRGGPAGE